MHYVYIIMNSDTKYYIGTTADLEQRLYKHNHHGSRWTKHKGPWSLVYQEEFSLKHDAIMRERIIKSYKGGNALKKLLHAAQAG